MNAKLACVIADHREGGGYLPLQAHYADREKNAQATMTKARTAIRNGAPERRPSGAGNANFGVL